MIKISQIAIRIPNSKIINDVEEVLGIKFYNDGLKMDGWFDHRPQSDVPLSLAFNHDLMPGAVELEYINSWSDKHWHHSKLNQNNGIFLSHLGVYCESKQEFDEIIKKMNDAGFLFIQDSTSRDHENKRENGIERSYRDVIFDSEARFGFNLKLSLKAN